MGKFYGCRPSVPDQRNLKFLHLGNTPLPAVISLRDKMPTPLDQGQLGSCTSNAMANIFKYHLIKDNVAGEKFVPSRLFIYYNSRSLENTVNSDSGATIVDTCKAVNRFGAPAEHEFPYDITKYTVKANAKVYSDASHRKAVKYQVVQPNIEQIKGVLTQGLPVQIGFSVYESFESDEVAKTGIVPMPSQSEQNLGGHSVVVIGVNDNTQLVECENSWGTELGQGGFFYLPYAYILDPNLTWELWAIDLVQRVA